ncbi:MAG: repressor LexA [Gammaproteobacteria bacterium RIFCSPLOWO2_02_FULL_61_13]|nr:MAG: repressor LexA [Gammaproteobacteria bacterium RIFCSPLOWO2_02_FULL_61_13]
MLTGREDDVLKIVVRHLARHGHAPTLAEIAAELGQQSRGTVHRYVQGLLKKGYLVRDRRGWRALRPSGAKTPQFTLVPLQGRLVNGRALEPISSPAEVNFAELLLGPDRFALQVSGDAMQDAGIRDGDTIVLRRVNRAESGNMVVAILDNQEAMLRMLRRHGDRIELVPANRRLTSLIYPADRVRILGVVAGLVRVF